MAGRPLYAAHAGLPWPEPPHLALWHAITLLREFRGDSHIAAWVAAGLDATEIGLLTEPYWGVPSRTYIRTRAWSDAQLDAAAQRLEASGHLVDGTLTDTGRALREHIELATDGQMGPALAALGTDLSELVELLAPWSRRVMQQHGYPPSPLAIAPS